MDVSIVYEESSEPEWEKVYEEDKQLNLNVEKCLKGVNINVRDTAVQHILQCT